ncbi:MAG: hypothetical protein JSR40_16200 [Proteobacteria bacterium]|nr:hypothetical protein [Pseudomonadota bacterium]
MLRILPQILSPWPVARFRLGEEAWQEAARVTKPPSMRFIDDSTAGIGRIEAVQGPVG